MSTEPRPTVATLFYSARERRLWIFAVLVVAGIYSTLWLAPTLLAIVDRQVVFWGFWIGLALIGGALLVLGLRARPSVAEIGVVLGVVGAYLVLPLRMATPEERSHLIEYAVVALLVGEALRERAARGGSVPLPSIVAFSVTCAIGVVDEAVQLLLPQRVFDPIDVVFNSGSAAIAVVGSACLRWVRYRVAKVRYRVAKVRYRVAVPSAGPRRHAPHAVRGRSQNHSPG